IIPWLVQIVSGQKVGGRPGSWVGLIKHRAADVVNPKLRLGIGHERWESNISKGGGEGREACTNRRSLQGDNSNQLMAGSTSEPRKAVVVSECGDGCCSNLPHDITNYGRAYLIGKYATPAGGAINGDHPALGPWHCGGLDPNVGGEEIGTNHAGKCEDTDRCEQKLLEHARGPPGLFAQRGVGGGLESRSIRG